MKRLLFCVVVITGILSNAFAQVVERNPVNNTIKSIAFKQGPASGEIEQLLPELLELDDNFTLQLKFNNQQNNDIEIKRYDLLYNNGKIEHASVAVMIKGDRVSYITTNLFNKTDIGITSPDIIDESVALQRAMDHIGAEEYIWQNVPSSIDASKDLLYNKPKQQFVYVQDFYSEEEAGKELHFAYKFDIYATRPLSRDLVYVDALTGKILLKDPVIKHVSASGQSLYSGNVNFEAATIGTNMYALYDSARKIVTKDLLGGTILGVASSVVNNTTSFAKSAAVDAHWGATVVYEYWKNKHGRLSYNGQGTEITSYVNYFSGYNNAFWNGSAMVYGSGSGMFNKGLDPLTSLDVCAHEVGHGVCQTTSALVYAKESGAINEGFSDIWAAVTEHYAGVEKDIWRIGEEIGVSPLRVMSNPNLEGDPDTYGGTNWVQVSGCTPGGGNDNCGVHTNSGVLNYWFYLLATGGIGENDNNDSFEVSGIGIDKAAEIAYATEQILSATATYADCRTASIGAAVTMFGNCSREVEAVIRAWHAVGVGVAFIPCTPQVGFVRSEMLTYKDNTSGNCPASVTFGVPMRITGNAPSGGNATINISASGSAVNGTDFKINTPALTVNAGDTTVQPVMIEVFDNADTTKQKEIKLHFTITQNGSNLSTSYTHDSCLILLMQSRNVPDTTGERAVTIGEHNLNTKVATPFAGMKAARMAFIVNGGDMQWQGVQPGVPINAIQFNVTQKNSVNTFENFTVKIGSVTINDLTGGVPFVGNTYYNDTFTTQTGWNNIQLSTPYVWAGGNIAIEICHTNSAPSGSNDEHDYIQAMTMDVTMSANANTNAGSITGCGLTYSGASSYFSNVRPVVRFIQPTYETEAETVVTTSRDWDVTPGKQTYFRNETTGKLIIGVANAPQPLGCTHAAITTQGAGLRAIDGSAYQSVSRSVKEFAFTPTNNNTPANAAYDMTLYFDNTELSGVNMANVRIVATKALQDSMMNVDNTEIVVPVMEQRNSYVALKANFTGNSTTGGKFKGMEGRYFITDANFTLNPVSIDDLYANTGSISVRNNPFRNKIYIDYYLLSAADADIVLYDITGKQVVSLQQQLNAGQGSIEINTNEQLLPPGNYILKVITDMEVMTAKLVKQ